jgi:Uma2 family endonuclease
MEFMASLPDAPLTEEQYLHIERESEFKSEFHDGRMYAMAGASPNHSLLSGAVLVLLFQQVPAGCRVFSPDLRIKVAPTGLYTYPDCSVICGDLQYFGDQKDVVTNPLLIVEVLSPSTEAYDRGKKFESYRTIESFREYLLIHQDRRHVEHYSKQDDGSWVLREHSGVEGSVSIPRLGASISLGELYAPALDLE